MNQLYFNKNNLENFALKLLDSYFTHIIWGITVGVLASLLTRKLGANYRCHPCDIQFSKIQTYEKHVKCVHQSSSDSVKKILILGGGYAGISVLRKLQETFEDNVNVSIRRTLIPAYPPPKINIFLTLSELD